MELNMVFTIGCTTRPFKGCSFPEACKYIANAGYTDIGFVPIRWDNTPEQLAETRKIAEDSGLNPSMALSSPKLQLGLDGAVDEFKKHIDNAVKVGVKWLVELGIGDAKYYNDYFELMRRVSPHAQQAGINISLKPHGGISLTAQNLIDAVEKVNHPAFRISYDPGNIIYYTKGNLRPETDIDKIAPLVTTLIIKDCIIKDDGNPDVEIKPGTGLVDFNKVILGLISHGFRGPLYVECAGGKNIDEYNENVKATLVFLKETLSKQI